MTDVLEKSIRSMGNIDNVESYSYNDLSLIQVELTTITPDDEVEQCWDMLRHKVSDACALLRASNLSITEVAVEVGYESYETFARAFRKRRGMSAASWRKRAAQTE